MKIKLNNYLITFHHKALKLYLGITLTFSTSRELLYVIESTHIFIKKQYISSNNKTNKFSK